MDKTHFARPELAKTFADELCGNAPWSDAGNGLFLSAPRRTGKTEFLRQDLLPELESRSILTVYVDLWEDKARAPGELIAGKLREALAARSNSLLKVARRAGLDSLTVPGTGLKLDLDKIGRAGGPSLFDALKLLRSQSRVALLIDEAQHALTSDDGEDCLAALKSARDQLRDADGPGLLLVMTGSHRDKLAHLVNNQAAAFWGSQVRAMPLLGRPFAEHLAIEIRRQRNELLGIDNDAMYRAFQHVGERPQLLKGLVANALAEAKEAADFDRRLLALAEGQRERDRTAWNAAYLSLEPLARALLWRLLAEGAQFKPYERKALDFYAERLGVAVSTAQAQKALESLRETEPPWLWHTRRGGYALYDQGAQDWYAFLLAQNQWPPPGDDKEHDA